MEAVQTSGLAETAVPDLLTPDHYALQAHPLLPLPSPEEAEDILAKPDGPEQLTKLLNDRGQLLWLMQAQPNVYGAELSHWRDADGELAKCQLLYASGGKRASKSEWAAKRFVEAAETYPGGVLWAFQDNERTSIATQQMLVWKYLSNDVKRLNGKKSHIYKINWSNAGGFTERLLVLPNETKIYFLTYNQVPEEFQGWELGAKVARLRPSKVRPGELVQNIGAWADENLTVKWLETLKFRLSNRAGKLLWTFSTTEGITATIKEFLGTARTVATREAELLPNRINLPGLPSGHMPFIQEPGTANARVIYFFTQWNPFSGYAESGGVKELCAGKNSPYIMMNAYGYCEDVGMRAFPLFGEWNVVKRENLPESGTNYFGTDPHGAWNWAALWARVAPGNPAAIYIYRDWPDYRRFGEWAVTASDPRKFDGDKGPAQKRSLGYGPAEYKQLFLKEEVISLVTGVTATNEDPYRARLREEARKNGAESAREIIYARYIDPRAGKNQHATEKGGVCLIDKLGAVSRDDKGRDTAPAMHFIPGPGLHIDDGLSQITSLLYWDNSRELMPVLNWPRLFVSEDCRQVIWALQHYTGEDGEEGACKAWIDILRYLITAGIRHIAPGKVRVTGGGSY